MRSAVKVGLSLAGVLIAGSALGGYKIGGPVTIGSDYALGSMGAARSSANTLEYITCWGTSGTGSNGGLFTQVNCAARDAAGTYRTCFWQNPPDSALTLVAGMSDAWVSFRWDSAGKCTHITTRHSSEYAPKVP